MRPGSPLARWWGIAGDTRPVQLRDNTDAGLKRLRRTYRRAMVDQHELGHDSEVAGLYKWWCAVTEEIDLRASLRMRYGAAEDGTDILREYETHDQAPSYPLAIVLDLRAYAQRGHSVLAWTPELVEKHVARLTGVAA